MTDGEQTTDTTRQERASTWFSRLRDDICAAFEAIEDELVGPNPTSAHPAGRFERKA